MKNGVDKPKIRVIISKHSARNALVAQPDRVFDYESKGQGFESLPARQKSSRIREGFLFCVGEGFPLPQVSTELTVGGGFAIIGAKIAQ